MKKIKNKIILIIALTLCIASVVISNVNADIGDKPSITIKLKNMTTDNYLIDLLVYDETGENYDSPMDYNGKEGEQYSDTYNDLKTITVEQLKTLYKINYDGWISESTRWNAYMLFADCSGNSRNEHCFSYFGTPDRYKILIINNVTGEIKLSDEIVREDFTSNITLDYQNMNIISKGSINIAKIAIILITTIVVEVIIALIMKLRNNIKLIVITNIITNLVLQALLIIIPIVSYITKFIIMEIVVIVAEYLIYKKYIKEQSTNKILSYALVANLVTALLTFFIK